MKERVFDLDQTTKMSNFNGRRGPNVSQYLRDLNAINRQENAHEEPFNMEEDLALFTNTQFFDFETNQTTDYQAQPLKVDIEASQSTSPSDGMTPAPSVVGDINPSSFDFIQGEFCYLCSIASFPLWPLQVEKSSWEAWKMRQRSSQDGSTDFGPKQRFSS